MKKSLVFKVLSVIVVIGMVGSMAAACVSASSSVATQPTGASQSVSSTSAPPEPTTVAAPAGAAEYAAFAKYSPEITLTVGWPEAQNVVYGDGENMQSNRMIQLFKDRLGINIKYDWVVSSPQYADKVNVVIASGEIPNVMQVSSVQLAKLVDADLVNTDLQGIFNQYCSPTQLADYNNPGKEGTFGAATFNGKLCAIPYAFSATGQGTQCLNIRSDWMKKLNLNGPATFNDLLSIMDTFGNTDFNGDGIKDGVGFILDNTLGELNPLFWCFHAYPTAWVKDSTGKIVYGSAMPEVKTALAAFAQMYQKGYIDKEFAAKDRAKAAELLSSNRCGIDINLCHPGEVNNYMTTDTAADFASYALPSADGQPVINYFPSFGNVFYAISKDCKYPEAVIKMFSYDCELYYGPGSTYEDYVKYCQDTSTGVAPFGWGPWFNVSVEKNHRTYEKLVNKTPYDQMNGEERWISDQIKALNGGDRKAWWMARFFEPSDTCHYAVLDKILNSNQYMLDQFYGAPLPSMVQNKATVDKIFTEMVTKIIMGQDTVDSFDKYVNNMNTAGLTQMTQEVNDWAAAQASK